MEAHDPRVSALVRGGFDRLHELAADPSRLPVPLLGRLLFALDEWRHRNEGDEASGPQTQTPPEEDEMTTATTLTEKTPPLKTAPPTPLLIDIRQLAVLLTRSVASLERDQAAGRLPAPVRIGGSKKWRRSDIEAWVAAGCPARATARKK